MLSAMMLGGSKVPLNRSVVPFATFSAKHNPSKGGPNTYDMARRKIDKALK